MSDIQILYRPVGLKELKLIFDSGMTLFPPRLPEQPIFYPVLNRPYAIQIARDWNTKDIMSDYIGFVLEFDVRRDYTQNFEVQVVGASKHQELWIPADQVPNFNKNIVGKMRITDVFQGEKSSLKIDEKLKVPQLWLT